ncbi:hypothetical protein GCM10027415_08520 [Humibacter ginsengisoli]
MSRSDRQQGVERLAVVTQVDTCEPRTDGSCEIEPHDAMALLAKTRNGGSPEFAAAARDPDDHAR